jgi:hypothetical protein
MVVLKDCKCEACGSWHKLYLPDVSMLNDIRSAFTFTCPMTTKLVAYSQGGDGWIGTESVPANAVILSESDI